MTRLSPTADRDRYRVDKSTGWIDYDHLAETAAVFKPRLIICGASAYSRDFDYKRFREIADECGAYLHCDMAHISGIVAAGAVKSPFEYVVARPSHSLHAAVSVRELAACFSYEAVGGTKDQSDLRVYRRAIVRPTRVLVSFAVMSLCRFVTVSSCTTTTAPAATTTTMLVTEQSRPRSHSRVVCRHTAVTSPDTATLCRQQRTRH